MPTASSSASRSRPGAALVRVQRRVLAALVTLGLAACGDLPTPAEPDPPTPPVAEQPIGGLACVGSLTPVEQCAALLALYNATDGPNWADNSGWGTDPDPCNWAGIICWSDASIQRIDLLDQGLNGTLPSDLGNLPRLVALRILRSPNLTGPIPPELADLPELESLTLRRNNLTGAIPPELGSLPSLTRLDLTDNALTGEIPVELANLSGLRELSLPSNQLTGPIAPQLAGLTELRTLSLGDNQLTGEIPVELAGLGNLSFLGLYENDLTGTIPPEFGGLNVEVLRLESNALTGSIPSELGDLAQIRFLSLQGNQLTGGIPSSLGGLNSLVALRLNDNPLGGRIPASLAGLPSLQTLVLSGSMLEGKIPDALTALDELFFLDLSENQLSGLVSSAVAGWAESIPFCELRPGNPGLFVPDAAVYRALDSDGSGDICGLPFSDAEKIGDDLDDEVGALFPGTLNRFQRGALRLTLGLAIRQAERGRYRAAVVLISSFIRQVDRLVQRGELSTAEAQPLLDQAEALRLIWIDSI